MRDLLAPVRAFDVFEHRTAAQSDWNDVDSGPLKEEELVRAPRFLVEPDDGADACAEPRRKKSAVRDAAPEPPPPRVVGVDVA